MLLEVISGKVTHDGVTYIESEVLDVPNATDAQRLIGVGACRAVEGYAPKAPETDEKGDAEAENPAADNAGLNLDVDPGELIKGKK